MKLVFSFLLAFTVHQLVAAQSVTTTNLPSILGVVDTDSCGLHLAEGKLTSAKARQIQLCLKQKGYDPGAIGNELSPQARKALLQYQIDNHLPQGNINLISLRMLGRGCKCGD